MTIGAAHHPRWTEVLRDALARTEALSVFVFVFFVAATLAIWTQVQPFPSMQNYAVLDDPTQSNELRKLVTIAIALVSAGVVALRGQLRGLLQFINVPLILVFAWFAFTCMTSPAKGLALNRLVLAGVVIFIAVCMPLLFKRLESFVTALGAVVTLTIVLCLLGVLFVPELAIHTAKDNVEQALAGDWRGIFKHKNDLGPMMIYFAFAGILVARTRNLAWGTAILVAALFMLIMSGGKSASLLIVPALLGGFALTRIKSTVASALLVIALVGGLALLTIGSVAFPVMASVTKAAMPDPTFTGRTDIWALGMDAVGRAPLFGYGYTTFWDTDLAYAVAASDSTAALVSQAHNGFIEVALSAGLPGLALVLVWAGIMPWRNIRAVQARLPQGDERAFLDFLAQSWLLTLLISSFEAVLFNRGDSMWFSGLLAIVCLQHWAKARLKA